MGSVIDIPLVRECHCGAKLRPATRAEIQADLIDPRYKHVAEHAAQGRWDWDPPDDWPDWEKYDTPNPPWVLRCDSCDARHVWLGRTEE
jgi:hypothetical protein